jgi:hypothetical protein
VQAAGPEAQVRANLSVGRDNFATTSATETLFGEVTPDFKLKFFFCDPTINSLPTESAPK